MRVACHGKRTEQSETAAFLLEVRKERKTSNAFERAFFLCDTKKNAIGALIASEREGLRDCGHIAGIGRKTKKLNNI